MAHIQLRNEILFTAPNRIGLLAEVTRKLHESGVNIVAIGAFARGDYAELLLLTNNNRLTGEVLANLDGSIDLAPVVVAEVENAPGELAAIAGKLTEAGVDMTQVIATTTSAPSAMIVIRSDEPAKALDVLQGS